MNISSNSILMYKFRQNYEKSGFFGLAKKTILILWIIINNFFVGIFKVKKINYRGVIGEIYNRSRKHTDINTHLINIFTEGLITSPNLVVELGTRGGESTFALEKVAETSGAFMVCVDLNDCSGACIYPKTFFVQSDDIKFGNDFRKWCKSKNIPAQIDLLFIDTNHEFEHTKLEIETYFPLLSKKATVIFHDTNQRIVFRRSDGTLGYGETSERRVIAAIESYLEENFNERKDFIAIKNNWLIKHWANCNGLTVIRKFK